MHLTHNVELFLDIRINKFDNTRKQKLSVNKDHIKIVLDGGFIY